MKRRTTFNRAADDGSAEEVKTLIELMGAHDWQKRQEGIEMFQDLTLRNPDACTAHIVKVGLALQSKVKSSRPETKSTDFLLGIIGQFHEVTVRLLFSLRSRLISCASFVLVCRGV